VPVNRDARGFGVVGGEVVADVQISLFPEFVVWTDELMCEFDDARLLLKNVIWPTLAPDQIETLTRLDDLMT